eukprot:4352742-Amphidinium_carterae.1
MAITRFAVHECGLKCRHTLMTSATSTLGSRFSALDQTLQLPNRMGKESAVCETCGLPGKSSTRRKGSKRVQSATAVVSRLRSWFVRDVHLKSETLQSHSIMSSSDGGSLIGNPNGTHGPTDAVLMQCMRRAGFLAQPLMCSQ